MIQLHGIAISNYYNTVKAALIEKDIAFEEVRVFPGRKPEVVAQNPLGKVPWITTDDGTHLSETNVILDYLEDVCPEPALYPHDPLARAKCKEIIRIIENHVDLPARRHIATVYFNAPVNPVAFDEARPAIEQGLAVLGKLGRFAPYIAGDAFTAADITAWFQIRFANLHTRKVYDWDVVESDPQLREYFALLAQRPAIHAVDAGMQQALAGFLPK